MGDYSDDEFGRDRFGRDRRRSPIREFSPEFPDERYRRTRSSRSRSPDRYGRGRYRSSSPRRRANVPGDEGNHYTPDYGRDGYRAGNRHDDGMARNGEEPLDPYKLDYLVPFRQFADYVNKRTRGRRYDDRELSDQYAAYKRDCNKRQCRKFFDAHKEMSWFREKYHPLERIAWLEEVQKLKQENFEQFRQSLESGELNHLNLDEGSKFEKEVMSVEPDVVSSTILFIKSITPAIGRDKVIEMCKQVPGFRYLAVSDPSALKRFHRFGWIVFEEGTDLQAALDQLNNQKIEEFEFHLNCHKLNSSGSKQRYAPEVASNPMRIQKDLARIQDVITVMDDEVGGGVNGLDLVNSNMQRIFSIQVDSDGVDGQSDLAKSKCRLDLCIAYLRQVHMFCYYCGFGADSPMDLERRCPIHHFRKSGSSGDLVADKWTRSLDSKLEFRDKPAHKVEIESLGGKPSNDIDDYMAKIAEQRFACKLCNKQFLGPSYVFKHLANKHSINIDELNEKQFYNNYIRDPNRMMPQMQQQLPQQMPQHQQPALGQQQVAQQGMPLSLSALGNVGLVNPALAAPSTVDMTASSAGYQPYVAIGWETNALLPQLVAAPVGTPLDKIPRIGFGDSTAMPAMPAMPAMSAMQPISLPTQVASPGTNPAVAAAQLALDPRQARETTSYVDLDAPMDGDLEINYG